MLLLATLGCDIQIHSRIDIAGTVYEVTDTTIHGTHHLLQLLAVDFPGVKIEMLIPSYAQLQIIVPLS